MTKTPFIAAALLLAGAAHAGKAHEHGAAKLDVAVDANRVTVSLEMPLDSLLGFEREPRTDAERAQAEAAVKKLRDATALFRIDGAAGCTPAKVELVSGALRLGGAEPSKDGHDDVDATYEFDCKDAARAGFVEIGLFAAFPRLARLDVQAATRKGQTKSILKRPATRLPLTR